MFSITESVELCHSGGQPDTLTPAQQMALQGLLHGIACGNVAVLESDAGLGRTTVLRHFQESVAGSSRACWMGAREFMERLSSNLPAAIEEAFLDLIDTALKQHELVIVDDFHLLVNVVESCDYPRANLLDVVMTAILNEASARGGKLVFGLARSASLPLQRRAYRFQIPEFTSEDYRAICCKFLDAAVSGKLDFARIHRFAPKLNGHQLRNTCVWVRSDSGLDTDGFIEVLRAQNLASNVDLNEVEPVRWTDLKGLDDLIQTLEAKIALPFENDTLAMELQLKPKRGVLLAGPPGTGKTTIGRALAHRLKSKFFLIDGTVVAESRGFYATLDTVFEDAQRNAPAIIFIDDADVIFESEGKHSFCRYLLTMLDGLESASAGRVCVMMTTMDVSSLPAAVVRSGRIELWLETRLPDEAARAVILSEKLAAVPPPLGQADVGSLARASRGLTGADLKSAVEDAKLVFAYDKATGRVLRPVEEYFMEAIESILANRIRYKKRKPAAVVESQFGFQMD